MVEVSLVSPGAFQNVMRGWNMKRNSLIFFLSLVALSWVFSFPLLADEQSYTDPDGGFSLSFPDYMTIIDNKGKKNMLALFSEEKAIAIAITYADTGGGLPGNNIQKLCKQYPFIEQMGIAQVKQSGFQVTSNRNVNFKGIPAIDYGIGQVNQNGVAMAGDFLMFINRNRFYFILFNGRKEEYNKNLNIFNTIMGTLKI
jgi:hypothetical protein